MLGLRVGHLLAELHEAQGVELLLGARVLTSEGGRVTVDDGAILDADIVLESVGVTPDTDWLARSPLSLHNGVMCDGDGRAAPNVYAVDDVASWAGTRREHWTSVGLQADHAVAVMLGQETPPTVVPYWWSDQYDMKLQGLGNPAGDDVQVAGRGPRARTVAVYSRDGRLTGLVGFSPQVRSWTSAGCRGRHRGRRDLGSARPHQRSRLGHERVWHWSRRCRSTSILPFAYLPRTSRHESHAHSQSFRDVDVSALG
ncbi:FAD-dependent oxidoreductase [Terrabacter sp. C0L_2]|uniref:FAD-dependent oxidoreductase n=1 Tax=Terrabacter sp. C0L_2 TaxID=3108389 RepID=UPI003FCCE533